MEKDMVQGHFCNSREIDPMGCDYFSFDTPDTHGACYTFTKGWCNKYKREVDKSQLCLARKYKK